MPLQCLPPGTQESQGFFKQIGENLDYIITDKFFRVAYAPKTSCLLGNRWSLAQLLAYQLPVALPQHKLPAEMQLGSSALVLALLVLVSKVVLS